MREEPTRSNSPVSRTPQELGLLAEGDVGDLVEEEGAAVGQLEAAYPVALGVGEGALDVAEQLALEQRVGDAAGVDGDHRAFAAGGDRVEHPGHHPLAGAVLAGDQDVGVGGADPLDQLEHRLHGLGLGDQGGRPLAAQGAVLGLQPLPPAQRPPQLDLGAHHRQQAGVVPRLLDEVAGAAAHRLHRQLDARPGGHHHDRQGGVEGADLGQQLEAFLARGGVAGVVEVHQQGVELLLLHGVEDLGRRGGGLDLVPLPLEQEAKGFANVFLVVGDEHARPPAAAGGGHGSWAAAWVSSAIQPSWSWTIRLP